LPVIFSMARIASCSRFEPGNRMMAAFMCRFYFSSLIAACPGNPPLEDLHLEIFNDLIGEQFLACAAQHSLRRGSIVGSKFDLEYFSLPQAVDTGDAERLERTLYGLALRI